ncbi:hypothetical protein [Fodinicola feengrottensis]|uniref:DUF4440 domain-containing protein n=1 Tax=Fodinicola feengrottensis TaxID=435914 RepID=A0ABN2FR66_9ACTN|nr:hypothetical protein [Fodinicola feengrottensis]
MVTAAQIMARTVTAAAAVVVLVGCNASPAQPDHPKPASPRETARQAAERSALAAYRDMWAAIAAAGLSSNAADPTLAKYAADPALGVITKKLASDKNSGRVTRGTYATNPVVTSVAPLTAPTKVDLRDCFDDTRWLRYRKDTGKLDDTPGGRHRTTAVVQDLGGWRVTSFALDDQVGSC